MEGGEKLVVNANIFTKPPHVTSLSTISGEDIG